MKFKGQIKVIGFQRAIFHKLANSLAKSECAEMWS